MKTSLRCLIGTVVISLIPVPGSGQDTGQETAGFPLEFAVVMSDYVAKRNRALAEFNRIHLEKFVALEAKYRQENREAAARAVQNKIVQLRKEIERLEAAKAGGFVLLEARYGSDEKSVDCLEPLLGQVREDRLRVTVKPAAIGLDADPHRGVRKTLTVKYLWNDKVLTASAQDGGLMNIPEKEET